MSENPVDDCLFCAMIAGRIPATVVYEDDAALAFRDINPQAPTHVLVIPKVHVANIVELADRPDIAAPFLAAIKATAAAEDVTAFRTVFNTGAEVGQSVFHVHAHVLAGRSFDWPPG